VAGYKRGIFKRYSKSHFFSSLQRQQIITRILTDTREDGGAELSKYKKRKERGLTHSYIVSLSSLSLSSSHYSPPYHTPGRGGCEEYESEEGREDQILTVFLSDFDFEKERGTITDFFPLHEEIARQVRFLFFSSFLLS
jgi:hypothetical protein